MLTFRSIAINYLENKFCYDENIGLACVYFDHKQEFKPVDILRSILKHILQRKSSVSDETRELYRKHLKRETSPMLKDIAVALEAERSKFTKIFLVIDALDECTTSEHTVEILLRHFETLRPVVRLMVTGRPFALKYMAGFASLETREIGASDHDVESFIRGQLNLDHSLRKLTSGGESGLGELIVEKVLAKAKGM